MTKFFNSIQPIHYVIGMMLIILFSPYIIPRLRIDHLLLVGLFLFFFLKGRFFSRPGIYIVIFYFIGFAVTFYRIIFLSEVLTRWSPFFDYMEWLIRGFLLFEFTKFILRNGSAEEHVILLFRTWVFATVVIGFIALLQMIPATSAITNNFIGQFYVNEAFLDTLQGGSRSASITSHPGTYGQIFLTSIIILTVARHNFFEGKFVTNCLFGLIILMSFFSLSKNIFLGIPLLIATVLLYQSFKLNFYYKVIFFIPFLVLAILVISLNTPNFYVLDQFIMDSLSLRLQYFYTVVKGAVNLLGDFDILFQATLGVRYLEAQSADVTVFLNNIFFGVGFTEHSLRLSDSGYTPFLLVGGIIGFLPLIFYLSSIIASAFEGMKKLESIETMYLFRNIFLLLIIFNLLIGTGQQTFTLDKSGDLFFILSGILSMLSTKKL